MRDRCTTQFRKAVASNGMFNSAGMVGRLPESGEMLPTFAEQAHQALRNLGELLNDPVGCYKDMMFVRLCLLDMEKIEQLNELFKGYLPVEPPVRVVCQPIKLYPGALVMFTAVAYVAQIEIGHNSIHKLARLCVC